MQSRSGGGRVVAWRLCCPLALLGGVLLVPVSASAGGAVAAGPPRPAAGFNLSSLLSRPLPGTPERRLYDRCAALEAALAFCEGVQRVRVTIPGAPAASPPPAAPQARPPFLVQISFAPGARHIEADGLIAVCLRVDPDLSREQISIVDGEGLALASAGQATLGDPPPPIASTRASSAFTSVLNPRSGGTLVVLAALVGAALALRRSAGRRPAPAPPAARAPDFAVEAIVALIQREGPEVGAAALALLDETTRAAVARICPAAAGLPVPARPLRGEVRAVVETAIGAR
jgi:hypothetical protein